MAWLFLIGAAFFVLGGLLTLQPSKTEKRIAALRALALKAGLHVKLPVSLKFLDTVIKSDKPYYCKRLPDRQLSYHFAHALRDEAGRIQLSTKGATEKLLEKALKNLPVEFNAIYLGGGLLGISWNESTDSEIPKILLDCLEELEIELKSSL